MRRSSTSSSDLVDTVDGVVPPGRPGRGRLPVKAAIAIAVVVLAELTVRAVPALPPPSHWADDEQDAKVIEMDRRRAAGEPVDVVVVGSSVADGAVDPVALAAASSTIDSGYNAAFEGSSAASAAEVLRYVVEPALHPRIALVVLSPREVNENGRNQATFERTLRTSRGWRAATGTATWSDRVTDRAESASALVRSRSWLRDPYAAIRAMSSGSTTISEFPIDDDGRLLRHDDEVFRRTDRLVLETSLSDFAVGGAGARRTIAALRAVRAAGVTVVVVAPPRDSAGLANLLGPGLLADADDEVRRIAAASCATLLDFRELLVVPDDFADSLHLNGAGTTALSRELGVRLDDLPPAEGACA